MTGENRQVFFAEYTNFAILYNFMLLFLYILALEKLLFFVYDNYRN